MLILMGVFAVYCGIIYNDFMAIGFPLTDSCYNKVNDEFVRIDNCVYPIGIDHTWH